MFTCPWVAGRFHRVGQAVVFLSCYGAAIGTSAVVTVATLAMTVDGWLCRYLPCSVCMLSPRYRTLACGVDLAVDVSGKHS